MNAHFSNTSFSYHPDFLLACSGQWLRLSPLIAPVKCSLLPLSNATEFNPLLDEIGTSCHGNRCKEDYDGERASARERIEGKRDRNGKGDR